MHLTHSNSNQATLFILGTPISDHAMMPNSLLQLLGQCHVIVGESRRMTYRLASQSPSPFEREVFFLDNMNKASWERLKTCISQAHSQNKNIALFSDTGMPILFDPGKNVLELCLKLGFIVHSHPMTTCWGAATALSSFLPPFLVVGFLPKDKKARLRSLSSYKLDHCAIVLMDTPYRFRQLVDEISLTFPKHQRIFVAWEIAKPSELLLWTTVGNLHVECERNALHKGEFVIVIGPT